MSQLNSAHPHTPDSPFQLLTHFGGDEHATAPLQPLPPPVYHYTQPPVSPGPFLGLSPSPSFTTVPYAWPASARSPSASTADYSDSSPPVAPSPSSTSASSSYSSPLVSCSFSASATAAGSSATPAAESRWRKRAASSQASVARQELKRRQQHQSDVRRRDRTNAAFARLQRILVADDQSLPVPAEPGTVEGGDDSLPKMNRVDILDTSGQRIQQLRFLVSHLVEVVARYETAETAAESPARAGHRAALPPLADNNELSHLLSAVIGARVRSDTLHTSVVLSSSACVLFHVPTGTVVDVSETFLAARGLERQWLIGRTVWPGLKQARDLQLLERPTVQSQNRTLCKQLDGRLGTTTQLPQYKRTVELMTQLCRAEVDVIDAVWRQKSGDNHIWDLRCFSWIAEWADGEGSGWMRQPQLIVKVLCHSDSICVDAE